MRICIYRSLAAIFLFITQLFPELPFQVNAVAATSITTPCDWRGTYTGTGTSSTGAIGTLAYTIKESHLIVGSITRNGPLTTFGWYRSTCDSVFIYDWYTVNNSFYQLKGKITKNRHVTTILGTFRNLTDPTDYGTFTMSKQL